MTSSDFGLRSSVSTWSQSAPSSSTYRTVTSNPEAEVVDVDHSTRFAGHTQVRRHGNFLRPRSDHHVFRRCELQRHSVRVVTAQLIVGTVAFGQVDQHSTHALHGHVRIPRRQRIGDDRHDLACFGSRSRRRCNRLPCRGVHTRPRWPGSTAQSSAAQPRNSKRQGNDTERNESLMQSIPVRGWSKPQFSTRTWIDPVSGNVGDESTNEGRGTDS